jgi:hypothetical protein
MDVFKSGNAPCWGRQPSAQMAAWCCAWLLGGACLSAQAQPVVSPMATPEQQAMDARLAVLVPRLLSAGARARAKATFKLSTLRAVSREAEALLDRDIDALAASAVAKAVNGDPLYPKVYWMNAPARQWFGLDVPDTRYSFDNPDNIYRTIPMDGSSAYVVHGQRTGAGPSDMSFSLISNVNAQWTINLLRQEDLVVDANGRYTITVDNQPANGRVNHIQSSAKARQLFIRSNLGNWLTETPDQLSVARLGPAPTRAPRADSAVMKEANSHFNQSLVYYGVGANAWKTYSHATNTLPKPSQSATLGTLVTQASSFGHFKLADDEALVATLKTGGARYFVFPVTDPWTISMDPVNHQTSLNHAQATPNPDGSYTLVVSLRDPGVYNWLDTVGLHEGTIMVRWQGLPETPVDGGPQISAKVVKLSQLEAALPQGMARVTPAERAAQLAVRLQGYQRRIQTP